MLQGVIRDSFLFDHVTGAVRGGAVHALLARAALPDRQIWPALAALYVTLILGIAMLGRRVRVGRHPLVLLLFGLPVVAGRALRSRVLLQRELRDKAERAEAERASAARRAIEEERDRIASELQAVVANGVSAMVIQAEAVPRLLAADDTASAEQALAAVEETGRDALVEMRRLLGVLRREDEGPRWPPSPAWPGSRRSWSASASVGSTSTCRSRARSARCRPAST